MIEVNEQWMIGRLLVNCAFLKKLWEMLTKNGTTLPSPIVSCYLSEWQCVYSTLL